LAIIFKGWREFFSLFIANTGGGTGSSQTVRLLRLDWCDYLLPSIFISRPMKSLTLPRGACLLLSMLLLSCSGPAHLTQHDFDLNDCEVLAQKQKVSRIKRNPKVTSYATSVPKLYNAAHTEQHVPTERVDAMESVNDIAYMDPSEAVIQNDYSDYGEPGAFQETPFGIVASPERQSDIPATVIVPQETTTTESFSPMGKADTAEVLGAMALVAVASMAAFRMFSSQLIRISAWCAHHPKSTKGILACLHTIAGVGAFACGEILASENQLLGSEVIGIASATAALSALAYPKKAFSLGQFTSGYLRHKACDTMLFVSGAAMVAAAGNHSYSSLNHGLLYTAAVDLDSTSASLQGGPFAHFSNDDERVADPGPQPKKNRGARKAAVIFGFIVLTLGVSVASCAIACAGQGVLAIVFLAGFETLLVLWLIHALRKIDGTLPKNRAAPAVEPS
jgi:hypothetical protein